MAGIHASRMRRLARPSRWIMVSGGLTKAAPMRAASKSSTTRSKQGVRAVSPITKGGPLNRQDRPPGYCST